MKLAAVVFFTASFATVSGIATAGPGNNRSSTKKRHPKLNRALNAVVDGVGDTDVIVELNDDSDSTLRITANGGRAGRKLGVIKARAARISNVLLKQLADDPRVKRVHLDRDVSGEIARTTATVGAKNVHAQSRHVFWGNRRVTGGVLTPGGTAWAKNVSWGADRTPSGNNIVWGENCFDGYCDSVVWGNNIVWGEYDDGDNIVWGNTSDFDNIVWGNGGDDNTSWGSSDDDGEEYGDDTLEINSFDPSVWEGLFEVPQEGLLRRSFLRA